MIIAIDGPAGSGKSTVAARLARDLGFLKLDTGAMYRAVALLALERGVALDDAEALAELAAGTEITFEQTDGDAVLIFADGRDVSRAIRTPDVDAAVSHVAGVPGVRQAMLSQQRAAADRCSVVAEGRDICSVVFPNADVKVFLTADAGERARRRVMQRHGADAVEGPEMEREVQLTRAAIEERDEQDARNLEALYGTSLEASDDAVRIDSSSVPVEEVVARIEALVAERQVEGR